MPTLIKNINFFLKKKQVKTWVQSIEIWQHLRSMFVNSNRMLYCFKKSDGWIKVNNFIHCTSIFINWSISILLQVSFVHIINCELALVRIVIVATISFATETIHLDAHYFFFIEFQPPTIVFILPWVAFFKPEYIWCICSEKIIITLLLQRFPFSLSSGSKTKVQAVVR